MTAARAFLKTSHPNFFYPQQVEGLDVKKLVRTIKARGSAIVLVKFGKVTAVPDVLWGQLYRSQKALRKMLKQHDFSVMRDRAWSNEQNLNVLIFEVENRFLPRMKKHLGPPLRKKAECEKFLERHLGAIDTISGPRVEAGRWVTEIVRKNTDVVDLLLEKLRDGGRRVGVADLISEAVANSVEVLVNEEVLVLYSSSNEFAKFLTEYLDGKPRWLM